MGDEDMLITNGNIHDGLGKIYKANIRVENGLIAQMGENLVPNPGEEIFDATGMEILPGFVQAISNWGVNGSATEIRPSSNDNDERSNPITPELDGCSACGEESSLCAFSVEYGGVLCSECAGSVEDKIPVTAEAVAVMKYITECDIKKLFSFTASDASLAVVKKIADKFTKHYLDF